MNENEEKILIFKVKNPCSDNCEIKDIQSCKTCNVKKRYDKAITYDTTIEKMAKALCADDVIREGYYQMAEAALQALLEGSKED